MKLFLYLAGVVLIATQAHATTTASYFCDIKIVGTSLTDRILVQVGYQPMTRTPHSRPATKDFSLSTAASIDQTREPEGRPLSALEEYLIDHPSELGVPNREDFDLGQALSIRLSGRELPGILNPPPVYTLADFNGYVATPGGLPPLSRFELKTSQRPDGSFNLGLTKFAGAINAEFSYTNGSKVPGEVEYQLEGICTKK
jgi:hypothetical protein